MWYRTQESELENGLYHADITSAHASYMLCSSIRKRLKQGPALYKEPWTGRAVSHFILDTELSTSPGRDTHKSLISAISSHNAYKDQ